MSRILIDDGDSPLIFSTGWNPSSASHGSYNNTQAGTHQAGATKVVRFIGTSIKVVGGIQPWNMDKGDPAQVSQYAIDDGERFTFAPERPNVYTSAVTYYQSPNLPMGEHVLMTLNIVQDDALWLDYIMVEASSGQVILLQSDGSLKPSAPVPPISDSSTATPATSSWRASVISTPASALSTNISSNPVITSSSPASLISSSQSTHLSSSAIIQPAIPNYTTVPAPTATGINQGPNVVIYNDGNNPSKGVNKNVIILSIILTLGSIAMVFLLAWFFKRRRTPNSDKVSKNSDLLQQVPANILEAQPFDVDVNVQRRFQTSGRGEKLRRLAEIIRNRALVSASRSEPAPPPYTVSTVPEGRALREKMGPHQIDLGHVRNNTALLPSYASTA